MGSLFYQSEQKLSRLFFVLAQLKVEAFMMSFEKKTVIEAPPIPERPPGNSIPLGLVYSGYVHNTNRN